MTITNDTARDLHGLDVIVGPREDADGNPTRVLDVLIDTSGIGQNYETEGGSPFLNITVNDGSVWVNTPAGREEADTDPWAEDRVSGHVELPTPERVGVLRGRLALARQAGDVPMEARAIAGIYALLPALVSLGGPVSPLRPYEILDALDGGQWSRVYHNIDPSPHSAEDAMSPEAIVHLYAGPEGMLAEKVVHIVDTEWDRDEDDDSGHDARRYSVQEVWSDNLLDDGARIEYDHPEASDHETIEEAWESAKKNDRDDSYSLGGPRDGGLLSQKAGA